MGFDIFDPATSSVETPSLIIITLDGAHTVRIALVLEYDGSYYCGWQSQRSGGSVQDALEAALSKIACSDIRVVTAGRTDTGVHASYQVLHFDTQAQRPVSAWVRGVNALLPNSIASIMGIGDPG